jgi:hypothetical protein
MSQHFEFGQPIQRLLPSFTTHLNRWLQATAARWPFRPAENPAAQGRIEMPARLSSRLLQRTDRGCDAASTAPLAAGYRQNQTLL